MKKLYTIATFVCALIFLPQFAAANELKLSPTHPSSAEVKYLDDLGLLDNYYTKNLEKNINEPATREEAVVLIAKVLGLDGTPRDTVFPDVLELFDFSGYIDSAAKKGIVSGYSDNNFRPFYTLTRGHLATFIDRAFGEYLPTDSSKTFTDVSQSNTAYKAVQTMAVSKITTGYPDNTFKPNEELTRKHLITFMYRTVKILESKSLTIPLLSNEKSNENVDSAVVEKNEKPITYNAKGLEKYLQENYSKLETKVATVEFKFKVSENDSIDYHYDYLIDMNFNYGNFSSALYRHSQSIKYADTAEADVELSKQQLNAFIEEMARDAMTKAPGKKILGRDFKDWYKYSYIKEGYNSSQYYTWTNYEPKQMKHVWPGEQPADYSRVLYDFDPSKNIELKKQYKEDESARRDYYLEYIYLKYNDMEITDFGWRTFLDRSYSED